MAKNYYQILGISKTATDKEIKQAYRRLAKQYHPDTNHEANAEIRFKEINEAHEVLSDKEKRQMYDQFGTINPQQARGPGGMGNPFTQQRPIEQDVDFSDLIGSIFGNARGRGAGAAPNVNMGRSVGQDIEQAVTITLQEAYNGSTRLVTKGDRTVRVTIPAGAKSGTKIRLAGEGEQSAMGGRPGDLYLMIQVDMDARFERDGDDLTTEVKVDMFTALLGGDIEVNTMERPLKIKIPAGTQSGRKFRLTGKGMPVMNKPENHGDLYARILITVPENLTDDQRRLIEELRTTFGAA